MAEDQLAARLAAIREDYEHAGRLLGPEARCRVLDHHFPRLLALAEGVLELSGSWRGVRYGVSPLVETAGEVLRDSISRALTGEDGSDG